MLGGMRRYERAGGREARGLVYQTVTLYTDPGRKRPARAQMFQRARH